MEEFTHEFKEDKEVEVKRKEARKILGLDENETDVEKINLKEKEYQDTLKDEDVHKKTLEFKERYKNGEKLDDLLVEAFALVKNACRRLCGDKWDVRGHPLEWNMILFDVQLIGGMTLHEGRIAEMKTGEGKTLVATLPMYLNALSGRPCFVVTVNEYLAARDSEWMGGVYNFLGLTVGVIRNQQSTEEKKSAYACDIVYGTNSEFGFDYLRDNMASDAKEIVQKELYYAIVDEVDSILIDEARTPLIISAPDNRPIEAYTKYSQLVRTLDENTHYNVDEKDHAVALTEEGIAALENKLSISNLYDQSTFNDVHLIEQALKARALFKRDQNYVVKEGEVIIVDEFTGRLMQGRRYSEGLHQAIEAKEGVTIRRESRTLATITLQNYFRMFEKLGGMTGTALTEAEEFAAIYNLEVISIPTNVSVTRDDMPDVIYKSKQGKYEAVAKKIAELHEKGQPALVGTVSIEQSEKLSDILQKQGIPHKVLNAKQHEKEAEIIAAAGQKGVITIATNMAGRGTDIKLGEGIKELGGLYVIGTERHESRRIDNQLRGRSGRQGDPGRTQFYVSVEDDLMRLFGGDRVRSLMERLGVPDDMPIENRFISNSIENAQKKVEGHNFDIRKHLVEYDDVINKHREIIYRRRRKFLESEDVKNDVLLLMEQEADHIVTLHAPTKDPAHWNHTEMLTLVHTYYKDEVAPLSVENLKECVLKEDLIDFVKKYFWEQYARKEAELADPRILRHAEKAIGLRVIDMFWMDHINAMSQLREKVAFAGYAQKNPLLEYKNEAFRMLEELLGNIQKTTVHHLMRLKIEISATPPEQTEQKNTSLVPATEHHPTLSPTQSIIPAPGSSLSIQKPSQITKAEPKSLIEADAKYLPKKKKKH